MIRALLALVLLAGNAVPGVSWLSVADYRGVLDPDGVYEESDHGGVLDPDGANDDSDYSGVLDPNG